MSLEVEIKHIQDKKFVARSLESGAEIRIDSYRQGRLPEGLNSSELLLASVGGCIMYYAHTYLSRMNIAFSRLEVKVSGEWQKRPLMIKDIKVGIITDASLSTRRESFLRFVHNCPVHNTVINTQEIEIGLKDE